MLVGDEQKVRLYYWYVLEFESVIGVRHRMRLQSHSHVYCSNTLKLLNGGDDGCVDV